ncbi:hypothetical protein LWI29_002111 [Acer saccharum]|uniref:Uncharacterized protein n=1 Tax=Acer saccharum TaxID=4024 RepID=A0AA39RG98_ACESA|nr:hypothetical protein LWI29_002111 [Acer saccharum]
MGWKDCAGVGSQGFRLFTKDKTVKRRLKTWQSVVKKNAITFKSLEDKLARVEDNANSGGWSGTEREEGGEAKKQI